MDEKILLSSYVIKIKNSDKTPQLLERIGESLDFLELFKGFTAHIFANIEKSIDYGTKSTTHLTLEKPIQDDTEEGDRRIYGFFSSGVSGEKYKIIDTNTNLPKVDVEPHDAAFRNIFFYLYVPRRKNKAFLILQRKSKFGIKGKLKEALTKYMRKSGLNAYRLHIDNILHSKVYQKMMENGNLKKVELIKNKIPNNIERYINNDENLEEVKGTFKSSFSSGTSLPSSWRKYIDKIYSSTQKKGTVEIPELDNDYDELEFELELNGKRKTFYMIKQHRIQPDIDVTSNVMYKDGQPTEESLLEQARELIDDITKIVPANA